MLHDSAAVHLYSVVPPDATLTACERWAPLSLVPGLAAFGLDRSLGAYLHQRSLANEECRSVCQLLSKPQGLHPHLTAPTADSMLTVAILLALTFSTRSPSFAIPYLNGLTCQTGCFNPQEGALPGAGRPHCFAAYGARRWEPAMLRQANPGLRMVAKGDRVEASTVVVCRHAKLDVKAAHWAWKHAKCSIVTTRYVVERHVSKLNLVAAKLVLS